ncbi:hypothetical protein B0813_001441 [Candidatus Fervidibacteria bacterium JGI MDM2 SSWTFF-3-K9]
MKVVSNFTPLISFHQLGMLDLLRRLFGQIVIPPAVQFETFVRRPMPDWVVVQALSQPIPELLQKSGLGDGEKEAITLALEINADLLLIDEWAGRKVAKQLGLKITGTLGLLLTSKQRGLISEVKPFVEQLLQLGFYADGDLVRLVLSMAGEST